MTIHVRVWKGSEPIYTHETEVPKPKTEAERDELAKIYSDLMFARYIITIAGLTIGKNLALTDYYNVVQKVFFNHYDNTMLVDYHVKEI